VPHDLTTARLARYTTARIAPAVRYMRKHRIDPDAAEAAVGGCYVCPIIPGPDRSFDIDEDGEESVVVEALAEGGETVLDLVAWSPGMPDKWWTFCRGAPALGMAAGVNPATFFAGAPLQIYRTPLELLQAACLGVVLLDMVWGTRWLLDIADIATSIAPRDDSHAAELETARQDLIHRQALVLPLGMSARRDQAA